MNKTISKKSRKSKEKTPPQCGVIMKNSPLWIRGSDYKPRGMGGNSKTPNQPRATNFFSISM